MMNHPHRIIARCLDSTRLEIDFNPSKYDRRPHSDLTIEGSIEKNWRKVLKTNPALYNASKYRLASCSTTADDATDGRKSKEGKRSVVQLDIGLTDYCCFQGTHLGEIVPETNNRKDPIKFWGRGSMSFPIGNAIVVETCDGSVPLLVRGKHVGEGQGRLTLVGGHPEPSVQQKMDTTVEEELYLGAWREVGEELYLENVPRNIGLLGIVARGWDEKPQMVFHVELLSTEQDLQTAFNRGRKEEDENCRLLFLKKDKLGKVLASGKYEEYEVMPDHIGALVLAKEFFSSKISPLYCSTGLDLRKEEP